MPRQHVYRAIKTGVESMPPGLILPRHRHRAGYATIVLAGSFVEASFAGRFVVAPGDVLLHGRFDCHQNVAISQRGPQILRLPWNGDEREGKFRVRDADELARLAERDPLAATTELFAQLQAARALPDANSPSSNLPGFRLRNSGSQDAHWSERLAADLAAQPELNLHAWSEAAHLAPETLSRGFHRAFGVSPRLFRLEVRTRRAWHALIASPRSLTSIAHEFGFADLPHLSRSIHAFTGSTPTRWRQIASNTARNGSTAFKPSACFPASVGAINVFRNDS